MDGSPSDEECVELARLAEAVKAEAFGIAKFVRRRRTAADFTDHSVKLIFGDHSCFLALSKLDYQHGNDWLRYWWSCEVRYKERVVFSVLMDTKRIHEYYDDDVSQDPRVRAVCESLVTFVNAHGVELVGFDHPRTVAATAIQAAYRGMRARSQFAAMLVERYAPGGPGYEAAARSFGTYVDAHQV